MNCIGRRCFSQVAVTNPPISSIESRGYWSNPQPITIIIIHTIIIIKIKIINAHCSLLKMFNLFKNLVAKKNFARSLLAKLANPVKSVTKLPQIPLSPTCASKKEHISILSISKLLPFTFCYQFCLG